LKETLSALFRRFLYFFLILVIAVGVVYIYFLWWERRESLNPEVVSAVPYTHSDRIPARAVLLWREEVVSSRWSGAVAFPAPGPSCPLYTFPSPPKAALACLPPSV